MRRSLRLGHLSGGTSTGGAGASKPYTSRHDGSSTLNGQQLSVVCTLSLALVHDTENGRFSACRLALSTWEDEHQFLSSHYVLRSTESALRNRYREHHTGRSERRKPSERVIAAERSLLAWIKRSSALEQPHDDCYKTSGMLQTKAMSRLKALSMGIIGREPWLNDGLTTDAQVQLVLTRHEQVDCTRPRISGIDTTQISSQTSRSRQRYPAILVTEVEVARVLGTAWRAETSDSQTISRCYVIASLGGNWPAETTVPETGAGRTERESEEAHHAERAVEAPPRQTKADSAPRGGEATGR